MPWLYDTQMWPMSPAMPCAPRRSAPPEMMPAPRPVATLTKMRSSTCGQGAPSSSPLSSVPSCRSASSTRSAQRSPWRAAVNARAPPRRCSASAPSYRRLDVTVEKEWQALATVLAVEGATLRGLVNNAGITHPARLAETERADWDRVIAKYRCRSGYEWDLIAMVDQQVHPALRANPPRGVAGSGDLPEGGCRPPTSDELSSGDHGTSQQPAP